MEDSDSNARMPSRVVIGTAIISFLSLPFGFMLVIWGSFLKWRSDPVLGLYNQSGWQFSNLVSGDGKITFVLGVIGLAGVVVGALLHMRIPYAVSVTCGVALAAFSVFEIIYMSTSSGITGPGHGLYMILGGSVVITMCSLGGYLMLYHASEVTESEADTSQV